jgi:hypothetical protein
LDHADLAQRIGAQGTQTLIDIARVTG